MILSQDIDATDLFCGAGGSSIGLEKAGAILRMAANHWPLAIQTHNTNFPNADHDCADISQVDPRRYPHTTILIASPECTNHSPAKTKKARPTIFDQKGDASEERSRATMWDVVRFSEFHQYEIVVVENVVEATNWLPFPAWLSAMDSLGYDHRKLFLNSFVAHPTPQSRDRMYVIFWRRGNKAPDLEFFAKAWCAKCEKDVEAVQSWKNPLRKIGKYRTQYVYRCPTCASVALPYAWPAAAAIDFELPAPRIGDRKKPLAPATMSRIGAGLEKFGPAAIIQAAGHTFERPGYYRTWPLWQPLGTQTTTIQHGLVVDTMFATDGRTRTTEEPLSTQTGRQTQALVVTMRGTKDSAIAASSRPAGWPVGPQTTQIHDGLIVPLRTHGQALPVDAPAHTMVAGNQGEALVVPLRKHGKALPADEAPVPTIAASNPNHALLVRGYSGGAEMTQPATNPTGTITARDHHSLVLPFLTEYHGTGGSDPVTDAMGTVDTRDRRALVEPSWAIEDCGFRMLEPYEIGRAMAFADDYVVLGNKSDRVRQYGNAVTPPVMTLILGRCIASLAP